MKSYQTSTDHEELKRLLDGGHEVMVYSNERREWLIMRKGSLILDYTIGLLTFSAEENFTSSCNRHKIQFIPPTKEVEPSMEDLKKELAELYNHPTTANLAAIRHIEDIMRTS